MRFPPEHIRERLRARFWEQWYRHVTLRRDVPSEIRPFLIAGAPRSGTSLLTALLDSKPNVITLNEPRPITHRRLFDAEPVTLVRGTIHRAALHAIHRGYVLNKTDPNQPGRITTDTFNTGATYGRAPVHIDQSRPLVIGVKAPLPLLDHADRLCDAWPEMRVLTIIRDPWRTINSWRQSFGWQKGFENPKRWPYYSFYERIPKGLEPLETRAHMWNVIFEECQRLARERSDAVMFLRYEHLLDNPAEVVTQMARHVRCPQPDAEIDTSYVRPQKRPNYKSLSEADVETITRVCGPAWEALQKEMPMPVVKADGSPSSAEVGTMH